MDPIESKVKEIVSRIIKIPAARLASDDDLVDKYGMDSLARVEVLTELEREFDITIDDSIGIQMRSITKCLEIVGERIKENR